MTSYRNEEINVILSMIDRYLEGNISSNEVASWAISRLSDDEYQPEGDKVKDYVIAVSLGALVMLSESEPEEFRTSREGLLQARSYLIGEESFPEDRIPKQV